MAVNPFSLSERDKFGSALIYLLLATADLMVSQQDEWESKHPQITLPFWQVNYIQLTMINRSVQLPIRR